MRCYQTSKKKNLQTILMVFSAKPIISVDDMQKVIKAGHKYGLKPKVHVNQFTSIGGIQKAIEWNAISVDHLEVMTENDFESLSQIVIPYNTTSLLLFYLLIYHMLQQEN